LQLEILIHIGFIFFTRLVFWPLSVPTILSEGLTVLFIGGLSGKRGEFSYICLFQYYFVFWFFSCTLPEVFDGIYLQRPDGLAMMQVYWVYWTYGYNNPNIIVLVYDPPAKPLRYSWDSHIEGFARGYIGFDSLYFGNLTSLLLGYPDSYGRIFDTSNRTIILTSELYRLTPLELSMSEEVNCLGVYFVNSTKFSSGYLNFCPR
jgi:hypothetical protein